VIDPTYGQREAVENARTASDVGGQAPFATVHAGNAAKRRAGQRADWRAAFRIPSTRDGCHYGPIGGIDGALAMIPARPRRASMSLPATVAQSVGFRGAPSICPACSSGSISISGSGSSRSTSSRLISHCSIQIRT
jgi:hypothetical protein